ncbi:MAG TPA: SAM-dependent methyltransferase [Sphingomicrobium sp.]|nr:SAM-dependent methyltransferase [Sphingomicrobium sp.]
MRHFPLLLGRSRRTSARVTRELFDRRLRALRRDRAARIGTEMFLYDRAFDDCVDRLRDIPQQFDRALLIGCPSPDWPGRLRELAGQVDVVDPGALFAGKADGQQVEEDRHDFGEARYDLCVAIGTLDTVNDLPLALRLLQRALVDDAPLIGALAGGNSLSAFRSALIESGRKAGRIVARTHPRIDPSSLAQLLSTAGYSMPVVDVDRVTIRYPGLDALVRDLRAMGATSVLTERAPLPTRTEFKQLRNAYAAMRSHGRTEEIVEILHFLGWAKHSRQASN